VYEVRTTPGNYLKLAREFFKFESDPSGVDEVRTFQGNYYWKLA
jgi:hypothetical protein